MTVVGPFRFFACELLGPVRRIDLGMMGGWLLLLYPGSDAFRQPCIVFGVEIVISYLIFPCDGRVDLEKVLVQGVVDPFGGII